MREVCRLAPDEILPTPGDVLVHAGMDPDAEPRPSVAGLAERAIELLRRRARPIAVFEEVSDSEFRHVFDGEGRNGSPSPIEKIHPRAERRALYAATLGRDVQDEIGGLFETGEFPLGYMLDAAASAGAENVARRAAERFLGSLVRRGAAGPGATALDYSPGYCGWHLTGQRRLFGRLAPGEIGIRLHESCLMDPLKSVSGAILVGPADIHRIDASYPCCTTCGDRECRERSVVPVSLGLS